MENITDLISLSVGFSDVGEISWDRGPSSSQTDAPPSHTEGKAAGFSDVFGRQQQRGVFFDNLLRPNTWFFILHQPFQLVMHQLQLALYLCSIVNFAVVAAVNL